MKRENLVIAISGATGFIGTALIEKLLTNTQYKIIGISRKPKKTIHARLEWRQADIYCLNEIDQALEGVDVAYYLVHSMAPKAHLDQGQFNDFDYYLAENFALACKRNKIKQVIYLGGLIPETTALSSHLASRLEVENILKSSRYSTTNFRAGLIIGSRGSSFNIMYNLVKRLPILICPKWTATKMTPIDLHDAIDCLIEVIGEPIHYNKIYEIGGASTYSYFNLLKILAKRMNLKRLFLKLPFSIITISKLWVRLFSGANKELVYPLLKSLKHPMTVHSGRQLQLIRSFKTYEESIDNILSTKHEYQFRKVKKNRPFVRSVIRLEYPQKYTMGQIGKEYGAWLAEYLSPIFIVEQIKNNIRISFLSKKLLLLELELLIQLSTDSKCEFQIHDGFLVNKTQTGKLEFRKSTNKKHLLVTLNNYYPIWPWYIFNFSQAILHQWSIESFGEHLLFTEPVDVRNKNLKDTVFKKSS